MITVMAKYFLRNDKGTEAMLYFRIQKKYLNILLCSQIKVNVKAWNKAYGAGASAIELLKYQSTPQGEKTCSLMKGVEDAVNNLFEQNLIHSVSDKQIIEEAIHNVVFKDAMDIARGAEEEKRQQEVERKAQMKLSEKKILGFYDFFKSGIKNKSIRHHDGKVYRESTISIWGEFGKYLHEYVKDTDMLFDDIDVAFRDGFPIYLENIGLMANTRNKYTSCFKKLCNMASELGKSSNATSLKGWKEHEVKKNEQTTAVYLTEDELDAFYNMPLLGEEAQARDLFLLGYFTCQRFSDYAFLTKDNFTVTSNGVQVIKLEQKKTNNSVTIPIVDERALIIAQRYDYSMPDTFHTNGAQKLNILLKVILKRLSDSVPSLATRYKTVLTSKEIRSEQLYLELMGKKSKGAKLTANERKWFCKLNRYAKEHNGQPLYERDKKGNVVKIKYDLISTHTARRSGATNLYKGGILDTREMMSITGHQTQKVFDHYIKVGIDEQAERISAKFDAIKERNQRKAK